VGKRVGEERRANMLSLALAITDGIEVAGAEAQARVSVFRTPPALSQTLCVRPWQRKSNLE